MKGKISEIFAGFQGEGLFLGEPQVFVRFFGCNLCCRFCDTPQRIFKEYEPGELFAVIKNRHNGCHSVSFTGGEPLLQKDFLKEVLILAKNEGFKSYLETNGTLPEALREVMEYLDFISMDLKLPSSTASGDFWKEHQRFIDIARGKELFLKAVICRQTSALDLSRTMKLLKDNMGCFTLVLQPDSSQGSAALMKKIEGFRDALAAEEIASCIIPQLHKIVGAN